MRSGGGHAVAEVVLGAREQHLRRDEGLPPLHQGLEQGEHPLRVALGELGAGEHQPRLEELRGCGERGLEMAAAQVLVLLEPRGEQLEARVGISVPSGIGRGPLGVDRVGVLARLEGLRRLEHLGVVAAELAVVRAAGPRRLECAWRAWGGWLNGCAGPGGKRGERSRA